MAHKIIIPEDGCLRALPSSNLNAFNNVMIVKVKNKSPGESTYQLATLNRSKKGTVWPADNYINKLIPGLPENKISDEEKNAYDSRKELNLSIKTKAIRPKLFSDQYKHNFIGSRRPNLARMKNLSDRSENCNRFQSKPENADIQPWLQNPWDNELCMLPDGSVNLNVFLATSSDRHFKLPNTDFRGFCPPGNLNSIHHNLSGAPPSSSGSFQNVYPDPMVPREDHFPNFDSYNKCRQNSRYGPNSGRHCKNNYRRNASNRGSRHDSFLVDPYSSYIKAEGDNSATNFMYEQGYSTNVGIGGIPYISPITLHGNYIPDSRYDPPHSSFEYKYIDQEIDYSVAYNVEMHRNNSNISYQMQYSRAQNNRKKWRSNTKFTKRRKNINSSNSRRNINSSKPTGNINSKPRGNMNSSNLGGNMNSNPGDSVNSSNSRKNVNSVSSGNKSLKFKRNRNSVRRHVYNKNQRKPWMANENQSFRQ